MNAETRIIGWMSLPSAGGTVNIRTPKAAMRPMPIAIFFGAAFGCAATSKTYVIIKPSYKYSSGSLQVLRHDASDIVGDIEAALARLLAEALPDLPVRFFARVKHEAHGQEPPWRSALYPDRNHFFLQPRLRGGLNEAAVDFGPPCDPYGFVGSDLAIFYLILQRLRKCQDAEPLAYGALWQVLLHQLVVAVIAKILILAHVLFCNVDQLNRDVLDLHRQQITNDGIHKYLFWCPKFSFSWLQK